MPSTGLAKPKLLTLESIGKVHQQHPEIGKALQKIVDFINKNVTPVQGTRRQP